MLPCDTTWLQEDVVVLMWLEIWSNLETAKTFQTAFLQFYDDFVHTFYCSWTFHRNVEFVWIIWKPMTEENQKNLVLNIKISQMKSISTGYTKQVLLSSVLLCRMILLHQDINIFAQTLEGKIRICVIQG